MTGDERATLLQLETRLFGLDGTSGAIGSLDSKIDLIESRLDRWDGAITFIKAAAGILGVGGISLILAAIVSLSGPR